MSPGADPSSDPITHDCDEFVELNVGVAQWQTLDDQYILEEDFKVGGEIWRVHKNDPDPFPSRPHAHCVGGARRFVGCKLHLGTGELFDGNKSRNRKLSGAQFKRLIDAIRPRFPDLELPLPT